MREARFIATICLQLTTLTSHEEALHNGLHGREMVHNRGAAEGRGLQPATLKCNRRLAKAAAPDAAPADYFEASQTSRDLIIAMTIELMSIAMTVNNEFPADKISLGYEKYHQRWVEIVSPTTVFEFARGAYTDRGTGGTGGLICLQMLWLDRKRADDVAKFFTRTRTGLRYDGPPSLSLPRCLLVAGLPPPLQPPTSPVVKLGPNPQHRNNTQTTMFLVSLLVLLCCHLAVSQRSPEEASDFRFISHQGECFRSNP
ncbi:hypothetical protein B566_EDAN002883 [Ephemera danica]|nr:hypothetical protein B566_EDAN002883 [Ephemera danica]